MPEQTYLHDNVEVVLTGRRAHKRTQRKVIVKVEIMPVSSSVPNFKKWVSMDELYKITDYEHTEENDEISR